MQLTCTPLQDVDGEGGTDANGQAHVNDVPSTSEPSTATAAAAPDAVAPDKNAPALTNAERKAQRKAEGAAAVLEKHAERQKRAREAAEKQAQWFDMKVNTSVYVTGLPEDVTEAELLQVRC